MRKKLAAMLFAVVLAVGLLSLSACGGTGETPSPDGSETPKQSDTSGTTETPETTEPPETTETPYVPEGEVMANGKAGESVTWTFYSEGTLVVSGTGQMENYYGGAAPWYDFRNNINRVVIEDGVTSIGDYAFSSCSSLTSVTVNSGVTVIGKNAFSGTPWLEGLGVFPVVNGILLKYQGYGGDVVIPDGVTSIGYYAFEHCSGLVSVTIPDGVTSIGNHAFAYCHNLTSVTIPNSVTTFENGAFVECYALTDVYYGGSESQWNQIDGLNSAELEAEATIHYNS